MTTLKESLQTILSSPTHLQRLTKNLELQLEGETLEPYQVRRGLEDTLKEIVDDA